MQAITTKYLGPTNHRDSRVVASCETGKLTVSWDDALNPEENHRAAAMRLATQKQWVGADSRFGKPHTLAGGGLPSGTGYAFVLVPLITFATAEKCAEETPIEWPNFVKGVAQAFSERFGNGP